MAWASIGGAVVGSVVNNVLGGGGGGASGQAMAQADPFAQYRAQFAPQVVNQTGVQGTATNAAGTLQAQNATTQQGLAQTYASQMAGIPAQSQGVANQMSALSADPTAFLNTAPSQAYLGQVSQATQRQAAASGMFQSGNEQLALQNNVLAGSQQLVSNQMGMLSNSLQGQINTGNMQGNMLTSGLGAQVAGLGASSNAAQQNVSNQGNYLQQLSNLAGGSQSPAAGYNAAVGGTTAGMNNMTGMAGVGATLGTSFANSSIGQQFGSYVSGLFGQNTTPIQQGVGTDGQVGSSGWAANTGM